MEISHIGVIGAGQMGGGIAHVAAQKGYKVTMLDARAEALEKAIKTIEGNMDRQIGKGNLTEADKKSALGNITTTTKMADLAKCHLVVEAATENEEIKKKIFAELDGILNELEVKALEPPAAIHYGRLRTTLEAAGTPIGANDMFLAAHALSLDATLVTDNEREFARVEGLKVENRLR